MDKKPLKLDYMKLHVGASMQKTVKKLKSISYFFSKSYSIISGPIRGKVDTGC